MNKLSASFKGKRKWITIPLLLALIGSTISSDTDEQAVKWSVAPTVVESLQPTIISETEPTIPLEPTVTVTLAPTSSRIAPSAIPTTSSNTPTNTKNFVDSGTSTGGDKDCDDFASHEEAQAYFESKGGSPSNNVDRLDRDRDGFACEE